MSEPETREINFSYEPFTAANYLRGLSQEDLVRVVEELTEIHRRSTFLLEQGAGALLEQGELEVEDGDFVLHCATGLVRPRNLADARNIIPQPEGHFHLNRTGLLSYILGADEEFRY